VNTGIEEYCTTAKVLDWCHIHLDHMQGAFGGPDSIWIEEVDWLTEADIGKRIWVTLKRDGTLIRGVGI
jgi:hypothetical protein